MNLAPPVPRPTAPALPRQAAAFTLLELLLATVIFGMVLTAIYATWSAILRTSRIGNEVATNAQRARLAARTIEDALLSAAMFQANLPLYTTAVDTSGEFAALSLVSRLPRSFPGGGFFGDLVVRRVTFTVETAGDGTNDLVLRQLPLLQSETADEETHSIILARDVSLFTLEFLAQPGARNIRPSAASGEWLTEWPYTNALPWVVRFTLAFGRNVDSQGRPRDLAVRTVLLPSVVVPGASSAGSLPPMQGQPGTVPPPGTPGGPGNPPPGTAGAPNDATGNFVPGRSFPGGGPVGPNG